MTAPEVLRLTTAGWSNADLPVLVYRGGVPVGDADAIERTLAANEWRADWRDGVYAFHHYHATAHEALACTRGSARVMLGGRDGTPVTIAAGDLLLLPAGTGHCRIDASPDFLVVGAYPNGQDWDVCREPADAAARGRIAAVPLPVCDPVSGDTDPLLRYWKR